jgi:hypothetical protein
MSGKIIRVDIDGTICKTNGFDYDGATPIVDRIVRINRLRETGNVIIYWTSRGYLLGIDYTELTKRQLKNWGCLYDKLEMNKPLFDEFYDDRAFNAEELDKI